VWVSELRFMWLPICQITGLFESARRWHRGLDHTCPSSDHALNKISPVSPTHTAAPICDRVTPELSPFPARFCALRATVWSDEKSISICITFRQPQFARPAELQV